MFEKKTVYNEIGESAKMIKFAGKIYYMDLDTIKSVCFPTKSDVPQKVVDISQIYEPDGNGMSLTQRVEHETKSSETTQTDMVIYDLVKTLVISILENDKPEKEWSFDLGTAFAVNTLIAWGILREL